MKPSAAIPASAALGFAVAALVLPVWTDNVESAQVVAGLVRLPADNPMRLYHLSVLSALVDSAALLLRLGASEWALSVLYSGFQGAVTFAAVTAAALALSASPGVALLVPLLLTRLELGVMDAGASGDRLFPPGYLQDLHGHGYPVLLPDSMSIFGVLGIFGVLLVWALIALRHDRAAAFLAGVFPWMHPTLAGACWIGAAAGLTARRGGPARDARARSRLAAWFLAGLALAAAGIATHRALVAPVVRADAASAAELAAAYAENWDDHTITDLGGFLALLEVDAAFLALLALLALRGRWLITPAMRFLARSHVAVTLVAVGLVAAGLVPDRTPGVIRGLMAHRWLNLNSVLYPVLVFSLLGHLGFARRNPAAAAAFFVDALLILFGGIDAPTLTAHLAGAGDSGAREVLRGLRFPVLGGGVAGALLLLHPAMERRGWLLPDGERIRRWLFGGGAAAVGAAVVLFGLVPRFSSERLRGIDAWTPVAAALAGGEGLFAVDPAVYVRMQLRTRRGQVLDLAQLNFLSYVPAAAPAVEHIMNEVYGSSLLTPTELELTRVERWEERPLERWQSIREEFQVTDLLIPWPAVLQLPLAYRAPGGAVIYHIPPREGHRGGRSAG